MEVLSLISSSDFASVYGESDTIAAVSTSEGEARPSVVDRVFCVLESCAGSSRALTLVDLGERTGLPKTTLHRMCWKLVELGILAHADDGFRIGTKLFALGSMSPDLRRLRAVAMPYLHQLVQLTGWATNLAVASDSRVLVVEEVYGGQAGSRTRMVGARLPLHATAIGKALLAGYDEDRLDALLGPRLLRPYTSTTVVRPNLLRDQLEKVCQTGVAYSHEEWAQGTSGVAAPVTVNGQVVAAVAVVGPPGESAMRSRAPHVRTAANRIGHALAPTLVGLAAA
jgi:DNA-binding IclR family transcriptional regulator